MLWYLAVDSLVAVACRVGSCSSNTSHWCSNGFWTVCSWPWASCICCSGAFLSWTALNFCQLVVLHWLFWAMGAYNSFTRIDTQWCLCCAWSVCVLRYTGLPKSNGILFHNSTRALTEWEFTTGRTSWVGWWTWQMTVTPSLTATIGTMAACPVMSWTVTGSCMNTPTTEERCGTSGPESTGASGKWWEWVAWGSWAWGGSWIRGIEIHDAKIEIRLS